MDSPTVFTKLKYTLEPFPVIPKVTHTTMTKSLQELEKQWASFQQQTSTDSADYADQLQKYQSLKTDVDKAYAKWDEQQKDYARQLEEVPEPAEKDTRTLNEQITVHQALVEELKRATTDNSDTPMEDLMQLWSQFNTVHHSLTQQLQTDE